MPDYSEQFPDFEVTGASTPEENRLLVALLEVRNSIELLAESVRGYHNQISEMVTALRDTPKEARLKGR